MGKEKIECYLIPGLTNGIKSAQISYNRKYQMAVILRSNYF